MPRRGRISIRLPDHEYGSGAYFVTLCAAKRERIFGTVREGKLLPSVAGQVAEKEWLKTGRLRKEVRLDAWVLMPNHLHAIVILPERDAASLPEGAAGAHGRAPLRRSGRTLGSLIAGFKAASTLQINLRRGAPGFPIWQRGYYDRAIGSDLQLERLRRYITENPLLWEEDHLFHYPSEGAS